MAKSKWSCSARYQCGAIATASSVTAATHLPQYCPVHGVDCRGRRLKSREVQ